MNTHSIFKCLVIAALSFTSNSFIAQIKSKKHPMDKEFLSAQNDGLYACMVTSKGSIYLQLELKKTIQDLHFLNEHNKFLCSE